MEEEPCIQTNMKYKMMNDKSRKLVSYNQLCDNLNK